MLRIRLRAERLEDRLTPVTLPTGFTETLFASGLVNPTAMAVAADGRVFVAEQGGTVRVVQNGVAQPAPFATLAVDSSGFETGLVGIAVDPNFAANGFVYVYYTVPGAPAHNRVSRFTASGNTAVPGSEFVVLELDPLVGGKTHNGGALQFGADGKLYVAVGDNGNGATAQSLTTRFGKILRINADGTIPADNPTTIDGLGIVPDGPTRAIWAAGLRNPFTFAFGDSGEMFINDVGQGLFEEVNAGEAGANYGWPATEGSFDPVAFPDFTNPVYAYGHNDPHPFDGKAIIGGVVSDSTAFPAEYSGDYFFSDLSGGWINVRDSVTGVVTNFADAPTGKSIVDMDRGPGGQLLYLARGGGGSIYQIVHSDQPPAFAVGTGPGSAVAKLVDLPSGADRISVAPFGNFTGGVRVASADVTGDTTVDLITAAGPGGGPSVLVFDGKTGTEARQFFAFEPSFTGGLFVAAGDVDQDGFADMVVSPDRGGGPRVLVVSGKDGSLLANFFGIDDGNFRGGCRVAVGDVNGDSIPDLTVAAGVSGGPRVAVFDGATLRPGVTPQRLFNDFFAFEPALRDGTYVAVGDADGDGHGDVVIGAGPGGSPRVSVFSGMALEKAGPDSAQVATFFTGSTDLRNGVPVAVRNADGGAAVEIIAGTAKGVPGVGIYKLSGGGATQYGGFVPFDPTFQGGVFVG